MNVVPAEFPFPQPPLRCNLRVEQVEERWEAVISVAGEWQLGCAGLTPGQALQRLCDVLAMEVSRWHRSKGLT